MQPQGSESETHPVLAVSQVLHRLIVLLESPSPTALAAPRPSWRVSVAVMRLVQRMEWIMKRLDFGRVPNMMRSHDAEARPPTAGSMQKCGHGV